MEQNTRELIQYFTHPDNREVLGSIITYFSRDSRHVTPVEAVLFWKSVKPEEREDYIAWLPKQRAKKSYEVWTFSGHGQPSFESDDPVEICHWLRARMAEDEYAGYNVHPTEPGMFIRGRMIQHDFIWKHRQAVVDDIIKKAFKAGKTEGVAQEIIDLCSGR